MNKGTKSKTMRNIFLQLFLLSVLILSATSFVYAQSAEDMIKNPAVRPQTTALKYIYDAGDGKIFRMYIHGDDITVTHALTGHTETYKIMNKFMEGNKLMLKLQDGQLLAIDGDRLLWHKAVYLRQRD